MVAGSISNDKKRLTGRIGIQQRVLPAYRAPFFELLAQFCQDGLGIFAGLPLPLEQISVVNTIRGVDFTQANNRHFRQPSSQFYLCWQDNFTEWLGSYDPAVLVVEANPRYLRTRSAVHWMHERKRPVLGWGLGAPPLSGILGEVREHERRSLLNALDGIIAYSHLGAAQYKAFGFPDERIFVAPNAVAQRPGHPIPVRSPNFDGRPKVLFVGRLQKRKRLDLLFEACRNLPATLKPEILIVGDGPARMEFETAAQNTNLQVNFLGSIYGSELDEIFKSVDLFVLPGTGGLAVQQALGFGLPVIVAQGDGTQDDMVRADNGWLVQPGSVSELKDALYDALSDVTKLRAMGKASYRIAQEEINLEQMAAAFAHAIRQILVYGMIQH